MTHLLARDAADANAGTREGWRCAFPQRHAGDPGGPEGAVLRHARFIHEPA
ncbi:hypothetical protein [Sphingobium lignivorans]|uniref:Uncharacterized protein n=1 Tax=Sphingobium lignivorans TaxID=2735886 RepID=A0ABR6NIG4_9SPHN|nr:hypothetical protein [Sphingobium lignivorans]MBB5987075.1 hypothetical protein [Sphingobium lignivorans]